MEETSINFGDIGTEEQKSHQYKKSISIKDIDINNKVVSNKVYFGKNGFKYFISYKDAKKIKPICVFLSKMSAYRKILMKLNIYFFIKDDELLKKYNKVWKKV